MHVRAATDADIRHVIAHLRPINWLEITALRAEEDRAAVVADYIALRKIAIVQRVGCLADGRPVVLAGAYELTPTVAYVNMVATQDWHLVAGAAWRAMCRGLKQVIAPRCRRAECLIYEGNEDIAWIERMGYVREGRHPARGKHGETFLTLAWVNPDFHG